MDKVKKRGFLSELCITALPISAQNLVTFLISFSAVIMVGGLGTPFVGGLYAAGQVQMILQVLCTGIESAVIVLASHAHGKSDEGSVRGIAKIAAIISSFLGILTTLVCIFVPKLVLSLFARDAESINTGMEYLKIAAFSFPFFSLSHVLFAKMKSTGHERASLYISLMSLALNVSLNTVLIFGILGAPKMGILGAGIGILVSRLAEFILSVLFLFFNKKKEVHNMEKPFGILRTFLKKGGVLIIAQVVWGVNIFVSSYILRSLPFGEIGAVLGAVNTVNNLAFVFTGGLSAAIAITVGKRRGENSEDDLGKIFTRLEILFFALGLFLSISLFLSRGFILSLYAFEGDALMLAKRLLSVLSFTLLFTPYATGSVYGVIRGMGDARAVLLIDAFFVFLVILPLGFISARLAFGIEYVFLLLKIDQLLKCPVAYWLINKRVKRKAKNNCL